MNILIFVMSMLMIFALMTYARLDTYRTMAGVEGEFTRYMETIERTYINMSADRIYDKITFGRKTPSPAAAAEKPPGKGDQPPKNDDKPKGKSSGRLSILPLVNAKVRTDNPKGYSETVQLFKNLIQTLYGSHRRFQELMQKRPTLIDELLERLPKAVEALPQDVKIAKAVDLSNLELGDGLDEPFYLMLKGCPSAAPPQKITVLSPTAEDKADDAEEAEEFTSDKSYDSLLNFVDLHPSLRINVYLASKPLLLALYGNPATVDEIVKARASLYKAVADDEMDGEEASKKLRTQFQLGNEESLLDFKVTGSDPRRYE